ncbi:hypothetical protein Tco_0777373 [Tanacetum coccineum]
MSSKKTVPSDVEAPREDQPLPDDASPTALSLGYVADSDPEEDLEEDPKEDPTDYPTNGGDDDDDDESSDDDDDDDDDVEEDEEEEEEEHLALADSTALLAINLVPLQRHSRSMSLRLHHYHHLHTVLLLGYSSPPLLVPSPPLPLPPPITSPTYAEVSILRRKRRYFSLMASSYERKAGYSPTGIVSPKEKDPAMKAQIKPYKENIDVQQKTEGSETRKTVGPYSAHRHDKSESLYIQ